MGSFGSAEGSVRERPFLGDKLAVPAEKRVAGDDGLDSGQGPATHCLGLLPQQAAVGELGPLGAGQFSLHAVLRLQILDQALLLAVHPIRPDGPALGSGAKGVKAWRGKRSKVSILPGAQARGPKAIAAKHTYKSKTTISAGRGEVCCAKCRLILEKSRCLDCPACQ